MRQRAIKAFSWAACLSFSALLAPGAAAQLPGPLGGGGGSGFMSGGESGDNSSSSDSSGSDSPMFADMQSGGDNSGPENGGDQESSDSPLAGLQQDNGGNQDSSADEEGNGDSAQESPLVIENKESETEDGSTRNDGLVMFPNNPDESGSQGDPTLYAHYTFSNNLQSVRTCFSAGGECPLQASLVFRDGELHRVRLFDEFLVGEEPPREEDTSEHSPSHGQEGSSGSEQDSTSADGDGSGNGEEEQNPLAGGDEGNGDTDEGNGDSEQEPVLVFENEESETEEGSTRNDGLVMFPNNPDENGSQGDPTLYAHYTFSDNLQSARTCFSAGGECPLQASLVFRDGELHRVRLFDEYLVGEEPPREEDTSEHRPSH